MSKILKDYELIMEGETLYDGEKTLLVNILRSESKEENKELADALESVPSSLQKFIISYIESYKNKTEKKHKEKERGAFEEAKKKGYAEGFNEGRKEALRTMEEGIKNIFKASESIEQFKNELYGDVKQDVINLSLNIAKTIVKSETAANSDLIVQIIADAINKSSEAVNFTICLNPGDYGVLNKNPRAVKDFIAREVNIDFLPDAGLSPGDTLIKTDFGEIDARIETQLEQIKKIFTKVAPD
ncbi:MAG: FliH/SctL family protein [bacterium]